MRALYLVLIHLAAPLMLAGRWLKGLWRPDYRRRVHERAGHVTPAPQPVAVWVHAVSVGEVLAALPLIRALVREHGERRIWVTTTTPPGSARVLAALGDSVLHSYIPVDLPHAVNRFLERVRPQKAVIVETEIWPVLYRQLHRRGIPLIIVNARLSARSFKGYGRMRRFTASVLGEVTAVAAQSEMDAQRFRDLGAPRVACLGNIKFDAEPDAAQAAAGRALRQQLGASRPVWIAASTHTGEETAALAAHRELLKTHADALLILVPRHPQRFAEAAAAIEAAGLAYDRRSQGAVDANKPVLLGDSMGEMWCYLAAANLAFVGGSFANIGGHNVLEPAVLGLPVLFGPNMGNFLAARDALLQAGAARELADPGELAPAVAALFNDPAQRQTMGVAGQQAVGQNRGAVQRLLKEIASL